MSKPLSFLYENVKYVTFNCETDFLMSAIPEGSNAVDVMKIMGSAGLNAAFKREFRMQVRDVPTIDITSIEKVGDMFHVVGTVTDGDSTQNVEVTESGIVFDETEVTVAKPEPIEEKHVDLPSTQAESEPVEERTVDLSDMPAEEKSADLSHIPVESNQAIAVVEPNQGVTQATLKEFADKLAGLGENTSVDKLHDEFLIGCSSNRTGVTFGSTEHYQQKSTRVIPKRPMQQKKPTPKVSDMLAAVRKSGVGAISSHVSALELYSKNNGYTVESVRKDAKSLQYARKIEHVVKVSEQTLAQPAAPTEITPTPAVEEVITTEPVVAVDPIVKSESEVAVYNEKLESFPTEIHKYLSEIPMYMFCNISEFTMNSVDEEELIQQGSLYCIDKRWKHIDDWFCIDVVPTASRFFYCSRTKESVQIPVSTCKSWYDANGQDVKE